jgi:hypothetical protein
LKVNGKTLPLKIFYDFATRALNGFRTLPRCRKNGKWEKIFVGWSEKQQQFKTMESKKCKSRKMEKTPEDKRRKIKTIKRE